MKYIYIQIFCLLIPLSLWATKFRPLSIEDRVKRSSIIAEGEIVSLQCIDPKGQRVGVGKRCTGPGNPNQLSYVFTIKNVLKDSTNFFKNKNLPLNVSFKFTSMAHLRVPEDNYDSAKGKKRLVFLQWFKDELKPAHQAFYFMNVEDLPKVEEAIKKGPE